MPTRDQSVCPTRRCGDCNHRRTRGGYEGPSVHIGAAGASQFGQRLRVSAEEDHILAACGAAAAIAAAFNTPLAGVVFVVEVLRVLYEVSRFLPIIVASVVGAVISRLLLRMRTPPSAFPCWI